MVGNPKERSEKDEESGREFNPLVFTSNVMSAMFSEGMYSGFAFIIIIKNTV